MPRKRSPGPAGEIAINMTPMIDCCFQLIIFFILAGQVASQALARVELPEVQKSQAQKWNEQDPNRVIVNVPSMAGAEDQNVDSRLAGQAKAYIISGKRFEVGDMEMLIEELRLRSRPYLERDAEFFVEIRADKRVSYSEIEPVLWAAAAAKIPKMNITALLERP